MCVLTAKKDAQGKPVHAKSCTVILGNKNPMDEATNTLTNPINADVQDNTRCSTWTKQQNILPSM